MMIAINKKVEPATETYEIAKIKHGEFAKIDIRP